MKTIEKIILYFALIGYILLIIATYLATVKIPELEKEISDINLVVKRIDDKILRGIILNSDYNISAIRKRINILELNNLALHDVGTNEQDVLKKRIINTLYDLIKMYSNLFTMDEIAVESKDIEKRSDDIINKQEPFDIMKEKLEDLLKECKSVAGNRLVNIQEKRKKKIDKIISLEDSRDRYSNIFIWLQIMGLVLLSFSGIMEKVIKKDKKKI